VLVLDLSGSVEAEYQLIMDFSRALSVGLDINHDSVRVGVVAFSDNVSHIYYLSRFIGQQRNLIESLEFPHHRGATNIQVTRQIIYNVIAIIKSTDTESTSSWIF